MNNAAPPKDSGNPRPVKVAVMLILPLLIAAVVACDSGNSGSNSGAGVPTATTAAQVQPAGKPYAQSPEGKPPVLGAPVPDPKEVLDTKPAGQLPDFLAQTGSMQAQLTALYQGAVADYDAYSHVPCYCGCAVYTTAHKSLAECFIKSKNPDGTITFTDHSTSCDICQGVAKMTVDGVAAGTPLKDVRSAIFKKFKYTQIWTDTPPVQ